MDFTYPSLSGGSDDQAGHSHHAPGNSSLLAQSEHAADSRDAHANGSKGAKFDSGAVDNPDHCDSGENHPNASDHHASLSQERLDGIPSWAFSSTIDPRLLQPGLSHELALGGDAMLGYHDDFLGDFYGAGAADFAINSALDALGASEAQCSQQMNPVHSLSPTNDFSISDFIEEGHLRSPAPSTTEHGPVVSAPQRSNVSLPKPQEGLPKRRHVKAQRTRDPQNQEELELDINSKLPATARFQAYFSNEIDAAQKYERCMDLYRKLPEQCTFPTSDLTFPRDDASKKNLVNKIFNAINDWSSYREWPQVVSMETRDRFIDEWLLKNSGVEGMTSRTSIPAEELRPSPEELARMAPSMKKQQVIVVGRELNDQMVEWIGWDLLKAAVTSQQGITQIPQWCNADGA